MGSLYPSTRRPAPAARVWSRLFTASQTWTCQASGWYTIALCGGGGSGGVAAVATTATARANGGSAGALGIKTFYAVSGEAYTLTIGAGGASVSVSAAGTFAGNPGAQSSWVGGSVNLVANGGLGGNASTTNSALLARVAGGEATGGDILQPGGDSGEIAAITSSAALATGGGAPNPYGIATRGGDLGADGSQPSRATGGSGVATPGGSLSSGSTRASDGGKADFGAVVLSALRLWLDVLTLDSQGSAGAANASSTSVTDWGGGSGACSAGTGSLVSGGALFGGSGAIAGSGVTSISSGNVTYIGGSGGAALNDFGVSCLVASGKGGDGLALLTFHGGAR